MARRRTKRQLKKYLRSREKVLGTRLSLFLDGFDPEQPLNEKKNFALLLELRWLIYDFIHVRLKLNPRWMWKKYFLDLPDIDELKIKNGTVELAGEIIWWAEGHAAAGEWWPHDHEPHPTGAYKVKIRGALEGGYWIAEPVIAKLRPAKISSRPAAYEIEFGKGSTYMKIKSR